MACAKYPPASAVVSVAVLEVSYLTAASAAASHLSLSLTESELTPPELPLQLLHATNYGEFCVAGIPLDLAVIATSKSETFVIERQGYVKYKKQVIWKSITKQSWPLE